MATTVSLCIHANTLKLRFYDGKPVYKAVTKCFIGNFKVSHWDKNKSRIKSSVPHSEENNGILSQLMSKYTNVIAENKSISAKELSRFFDKKKSCSLVSIDELIKRDIENEKKKKGCNYKNYEKLHRRLLEFRPNLKDITISKVDEAFCIDFRDWIVDVHKTNYEKTTKCFMALLRRISEDKSISWTIEKINGYSFKKNAPIWSGASGDELPEALCDEEIRSFYKFDPVANVEKRIADRVEIYYDYCIFMLETYMRPVDVLLLKKDNIKTNKTMFRVPTIQYIPKKKENLKGKKAVQVPLSRTALSLVEKYKGQSPDGYIFPIASSERIKGYEDGVEGFAKRINMDINVWLKTVDKTLGFNRGVKFNLYVFRHTSISVGLNIHKHSASTIAGLAGTSIGVIEKHYNNHTISDIPMGILEAFDCNVQAKAS